MSRGRRQRPAPAAPSPTAGTTRTRFVIEGDLIIVSPLHVGTGQTAVKPGVTGKDGTPPPEVAELLRDGNDRPFLPGTTLKGILRRIAEGMPPTPNCVALFGEKKDDDSGAMGR